MKNSPVPRENVNFRLDGEIVDELREEADDQGYGNLSAYLRAIIRNRETEQDRLNEHERRIQELERRVADLERDVSE